MKKSKKPHFHLSRPVVGIAGILASLQPRLLASTWIEKVLANASWFVIISTVIIAFSPWPNKINLEERRLCWVLLFYLLYTIGLEIASRRMRNGYDRNSFRLTRIISNVVTVIALVWFSQGQESYFRVFFALPVFQATLYFNNAWLFAACGILLVEWMTITAFAQTHQQALDVGRLIMDGFLLFIMAIPIARVLAYARSMKAKEVHEREVLRQSTLEITKHWDKEDLLASVVRQGIKILEASGGGIYEYDEEGGDLTVVAEVGTRQSILGHKLRLGQGMAGQVVQSGQPMIVQDYSTWPWRDAAYDVELFGAVIEVPLLWEGSILGVLYVTDDAPFRAFDDHDVHLLSLLSIQASMTIQHAKLIKQARGRALEIQAIAELSATGALSYRAQEMVSQMVRLLVGSTGSVWGSVTLLQVSQGEEALQARIRNIGPHSQAELRSLNLPTVGVELPMMENGQPLLLRGSRTESPCDMTLLHDLLGTTDHFEWMCLVPISLDNGPAIGIICIAEKRHLTAEDEASRLETCKWISGHIALIVTQARLLNTTHERLGRLEALHRKSTETIMRAPDPDLLRVILSEAVALLRASGGGLYLLEEDKKSMRLKVSMNIPDSIVSATVEMGQGAVWKSIEEKRAVIIRQYSKWPQRLGFLDDCGLDSVAAAPIVWGEPLGSIAVHSVHPERVFSEDDLLVLSHIGNLAAVALDYARRTKSEARYEKREREQEGYRVLIQESPEWRNREEAVIGVLERAGQLLSHTAAEVFLWDRGETSTSPTCFLGDRRLNEGHQGLELGAGVAGWIAKERNALRINNLKSEKLEKSSLSIGPDIEENVNSIIGVPLLAEAGAVGAMVLMHSERDKYDDEDVATLARLAGLIVVRLRHMSQTERLQRAGLGAVIATWGSEVGHDVNHEAGAIRRVLYLLRTDPRLNDELKPLVERADEYAGELAIPSMSNEMGNIDACTVLSQILASELSRARKRWPDVNWTVSDDTPEARIKISAWAMTRIMRQLLRNAAEAVRGNREDKSVSVLVGMDNEMAMVEVRDSGPGIPQDVAMRLFRQAIEKPNGPGVGLLLVATILDLHGGHIGLLRCNEGARICLWVPLAAEDDDG